MSLTIWHDHATVLGNGYIMITIHTMDDPAVYLAERKGVSPTTQTIIEQPEVYIFALNSSSVKDQASIIRDRVECLHSLSVPILARDGIVVNDTLRFFTGDHPAKQFERGTQVGGVYKCGGCGCRSDLMDDQAHALACRTRSTEELQCIALKGVLGRVPCIIKPLYVRDLSIAEIRQELRARGVANVDRLREELQPLLQDILKGVQRVPSLLLLKPDQKLCNLKLQNYRILDCEPMHDIKGHLLNLFEKLPSILPASVRATCETASTSAWERRKRVLPI